MKLDGKVCKSPPPPPPRNVSFHIGMGFVVNLYLCNAGSVEEHDKIKAVLKLPALKLVQVLWVLLVDFHFAPEIVRNGPLPRHP